MSSRQRDYSMDILKVFGTLVVLGFHYQQMLHVYFEDGYNLANGPLAFDFVVEMFFLISGYFMYSYISKIQDGMTFKEFYLKRFLRIFPIMAITAVAFEILEYFYSRVFGIYWFNVPLTMWGTFTAAIGMHDGWGAKNLYVNTPTWYISVLMLCYAIFYFLCYISKKKNFSVNILFILMIIAGVGIQDYEIDLPFMTYTTSRGYIAFFYGVLLFGIFKNHKPNTFAKIVSLAFVILMPLLSIFYPAVVADNTLMLTTFLYVPALIIVVRTKPVMFLLGRKPIAFLSDISLDVYVWHASVLIAVEILLTVIPNHINLYSRWTVLLFILICFMVGTASYYLIEKPIAKAIKNKMSE